MQLSLTGKTALICGSTQGIGFAIAQALAELGANCILLARNEQALKECLTRLPVNDGQHHHYFIADFSKPGEALSACKKALDFGPIHILINNTGGPKAGSIEDAKPEEFTNAFAQHVVNNQELVQAVFPGMKAEKFGRIINIISTSVKVPLPNLGVSNTIRGAVASWAKTLANELGEFNITVNNVLPGLTKTGRLDSLIATTAQSRGVPVEQVEKEMKASIPVKRFATPEEIAVIAAFLATPAAAYVNGVSIPVDGGRTGSI